MGKKRSWGSKAKGKGHHKSSASASTNVATGKLSAAPPAEDAVEEEEEEAVAPSPTPPVVVDDRATARGAHSSVADVATIGDIETGDDGQPTTVLERRTRRSRRRTRRSKEEEDDDEEEEDDDVEEGEEEHDDEGEDDDDDAGLATLPNLGDPCAAAGCDLFTHVCDPELDAVVAPPSGDRRSGTAALSALFAARGDGVKVRCTIKKPSEIGLRVDEKNRIVSLLLEWSRRRRGFDVHIYLHIYVIISGQGAFGDLVAALARAAAAREEEADDASSAAAHAAGGGAWGAGDDAARQRTRHAMGQVLRHYYGHFKPSAAYRAAKLNSARTVIPLYSHAYLN